MNYTVGPNQPAVAGPADGPQLRAKPTVRNRGPSELHRTMYATVITTGVV